MILYIIVALVILMAACWLLISNSTLRWICGLLSTGALLVSVLLLCLNMQQHYGMKQQTVTTKEKQIYSAGVANSPVNMLLAQRLGKSANNYVLVYRDQAKDKKPATHFMPNKKKIVSAVKKRAHYQLVATKSTKATTQTKSTYWVYKNKTMEKLFDLNNSKRILIKQRTVVKVPKDTWVILSAQQAKSLAKKQKQTPTDPAQTKAAQQQMQQVMGMQLKQYQQKHPKASASDLKQYTQYLQAKMAAQQVKMMLK
ncbi:DUF4811 domain-containing protein [Bombilactobacillus thymidiniphilus]|uniref:DUF4811 domain-containing protein n=1 Tax=Bombilactobacillus thymidiniphilus TaxID=2923363 RepID=A0ABY4PDV0_9LACO|nr:DUF4811 domain-containing protein [Bombilactobacillus thymidiniphilus]UQS83676.1 DUF4811 domain-containing protein [Bombilactobacillus thymidiniphilus]